MKNITLICTRYINLIRIPPCFYVKCIGRAHIFGLLLSALPPGGIRQLCLTGEIAHISPYPSPPQSDEDFNLKFCKKYSQYSDTHVNEKYFSYVKNLLSYRLPKVRGTKKCVTVAAPFSLASTIFILKL